MSEKTIEYDKETNIIFVDQEKAFDRVNRTKLWKTLEEYGVKGQLLDNIRALYRKSISVVRTREGNTNWFEVKSGVRQGCVLSPLLFISYMDKITKEANQSTEDLNELLFADDQSIIHPDQQSLQKHIARLNNSCKKYDMRINTAKTEVMKISRTRSPLNISINSEKLNQVQEFKYLGSTFTEDGSIDREIEIRTQKANAVTYQLAPILSHPNITMDTKRQLISSIFIPTLCYQCQTWTLGKSHERKITACEMKCLRKTLGITRRDRWRNEDVRTNVGIEPCLQYIDKQRIKWFGHLSRMTPNQPASRAYNTRYSGYKRKGRPRKRWIDGVKETLKRNNISVQTAAELAYHRKLHLPSTLNGNIG